MWRSRSAALSGGVGAVARSREEYGVARSQEEYGNLLDFSEEANMEHRELVVSSKGNISATFRVPGLISIPSNGQAHNVTIVQLKLDASMTWVSVPKEDSKTHLKVCTSNEFQG